MNKKGDVFQLLVVLILLFVTAIVGLLFLTLSNKVNEFWTTSGIMNGTQNQGALNAQQTIQATSAPTTDYMIFFLFLGANLGLIAGAVRTKFSPTIIFFFILLLFITILIASGIVNIYQGFATGSATSTTASQLTLTNFIFSKYLPVIMTGIGILVMLVAWGKSGGDIIQ
jgi:hypothetical protein